MKVRGFITPFLFLSFSAWAETSTQPYIDKLKQSLPEEKSSGSSSQPFIDSQKSKLESAPSPQGYSEKIRQTDPEKTQESSSGFTEKERIKLEPETQGSAIDAVHQGKSELKLKRAGSITKAAGVRVGVFNERAIKVMSGTQDFYNVYPKKWVPDVSLFFEVQPFHSEWFGNFGFWGSAGYMQFKGQGQFAQTLYNPVTNQSFGSGSRTEFRFNVLPLAAGINYRFNLLRYVRPFVMAGGLVVPYWENRSDDKSGHRGRSQGYYATAGVAILLDWLSRGSAWDLYDEAGVKHYYLTIEYSRMETLGKRDVQFKTSGLYSGFSFEF